MHHVHLRHAVQVQLVDDLDGHLQRDRYSKREREREREREMIIYKLDNIYVSEGRNSFVISYIIRQRRVTKI